MKVKLTKTHNPQDYYQGIEEPGLTESTILNVDLPELITVPLDEGYQVILENIREEETIMEV